ncbi:MAG: enoyl-CoA hydratase/isomerase family protein [Candidatus Sericytochromatia bacterium]|nr:enoyl-CoA hydratase/isomerase family protein [Candidatus Tanganyikabacteria bacterium]
MIAASPARPAGPFAPRAPEAFGFQDITYEKRDWVAKITINRPANFNAYSTQALQEMIVAFQDAAWDDGVAVIVLTGEGTKAFCTGGDVKDYDATYTKRPRDYWKWMGVFAQCLDTIRNTGKPTIARVNGMAVGGGNEMNLACDLAIAAEHAAFRQVGTRVGSVACGGATQWLPIVVGDRRARQMLYLCESVDAATALDWGLVNEIVPSVTKDGQFVTGASPEEIRKAQKGEDGYALDLSRLDAAVAAMARKLIDKFPECLRYTKAQVNFWKDFSWHMTVGHARDWLSLHFVSPELHEGMGAFVDKRDPDYVGLRERARDGGSSEYLYGPPTRTCGTCQARGLPADFPHCGRCGAALEGAE